MRTTIIPCLVLLPVLLTPGLAAEEVSGEGFHLQADRSVLRLTAPGVDGQREVLIVPHDNIRSITGAPSGAQFRIRFTLDEFQPAVDSDDLRQAHRRHEVYLDDQDAYERLLGALYRILEESRQP